MAQTTGVMNASKFVIYSGASLAAATPIGYALDCSLSISHEPRDTTTKFSGGWRDLLEGLRQWSVSGTHLFAEDSANGEAELFASLNNRTKLFVKATVHEGSDENSGDTRYAGSGYITSIEKSGGVEDNVQFSFSFEGSGVLSRETIT